MPTVLIAGGTGLVGTRLSTLLKTKGWEVIHLSRTPNLDADFPAYAWDINKDYIDERAIIRADYIINLTGAGIADKRWTTQRKKELLDSRIKSTQLLINAIKKRINPLKAFVNASAIGYYGNTADKWLFEDDAVGEGFMGECCAAWEKTAMSLTDIRTVIIRIGIVLSIKGGALEKMILPYHLNAGVYFGNGEQYYSWIHIDDICNIFIKALEDETMLGIYNGVAPNPVTNKDFAIILGKALDKKTINISAPTLAMRIALGEMADTILNSNRVSAAKIISKDFVFQYNDLYTALCDILKRKI